VFLMKNSRRLVTGSAVRCGSSFFLYSSFASNFPTSPWRRQFIECSLNSDSGA
jgi:hypothetical protein